MKRKNMKRGAALFLSAAVIFSGGWGTIPQYVHAEEEISEQDMQEETGQPETDVETTADITETEPVTNLPGEALQQAGEEEMKPEGEQTEPVQEESAADGDQEQKKAAAANAETLAEEDVPLDKEHFPDEVFRALVKDQVDTNEDGTLSWYERNATSLWGKLYVEGDITTLQGIEYLNYVEEIYFRNNSRVGTADLSKNENLERIQVNDNLEIGSLNASGLANLSRVDLVLASVKINYLDFSGCTALKKLDLSDFSSEEIKLNGASGLTTFITRENCDIKNIDFSGCTELQKIWLSSPIGNDLTNPNLETLTLKKLPKLSDLNCSYTGVKKLILEDLPELTELNCTYTEISELDVSNLTGLEVLYAGKDATDKSEESCPLEKIVLGNHPNLKGLYCSYTKIPSLDLSECTNTETLTLDGNKNLTSLDITRLAKLKRFSCKKSAINKLDLSRNSALKDLDCSNTKLNTLDVSNNPAIQMLDCSYTDIGELELSNLKELTFLSIAHTDIKGLSLASDLKPSDTFLLDGKRYTNTLLIWTAGTALASVHVQTDGRIYYTEIESSTAGDYWLGAVVGEEAKELKDSLMYNYSSEITLSAEKGKVDLKDYCSIFDPQRVLSVKGASLNGSILSDLTPGQPVTYTYCMKRVLTEAEREFLQSEPEKKQEYIDSNYEQLKQVADGYGMSEEEFEKLWQETLLPEMEKEWPERWEGQIQNELNLSSASIMTVTLNISVTNAWKQELTIEDITYGGTPSPSAVPLYGKDAVKYVYSTQKDGDYTENVPVTAGTYWVKAVAPAGEGYAEITSDPVSFEIQKAVPKFEVPSGLTAKEGQTLKDVKLPAGFTWADESQSVGKAGTHTFKAVYTPEDTVNYEIVKGIEIKVQVSADAVSGGSGSTGGKDNTADNGKNTTPSTGVSEYPWLWLGMLALSGGTLGLTAWKKHRRL